MQKIRMTRWLLILLMFALPLQMTFAAAAVCCTHAQDVVAQQLDEDDAGGLHAAADCGDCDDCHHLGSAVPPAPAPALPTVPPVSHIEQAPCGFASFIPEPVPPPDRSPSA